MKSPSLSLLTAFCMLLAPLVQANQLDGVFSGISISLNSAETDIISKPFGSLNLKNDGYVTGFGFNLGYGQSFEKFYIGGDFSFKTAGGNSKSDNFYNPLTGYYWYEKELQNQKFVSIVPGFYIQTSTLIFGRLGIGAIEVTDKFRTVKVKTETVNGKIFGIGAKHFLNKKISAWFELQHIVANQTQTTTISDAAAAFFDDFEVKTTASSANLGIQYNF